MSGNLEFDFSINRGNNTITVKREFDAGLPLVWGAYTKSEFLDQWWAPKPWKAKTKTMDFSEGGQWLYAMVGPKGEEHWSVAEYKTIQFQKKFTGLDAFSDADGIINKDMPQSKWEVSFTGREKTTLVEYKISFDDLARLEATIKMGFKEGLTTAVEGLDELLTSLRNKNA